MKLYTRTGDAGQTALFDGTRVSKGDARVDAYGEVDELNAVVGMARAHIEDVELTDMLVWLQRDLFALGAHLADPSTKVVGRKEKAALTPRDVERLEGWIDKLEEELPPLRRFILAGGAPSGAWLHLARTVCRRAERRMVALGPDAVEPTHLAYVNRVSDLLFVMARAANRRAGKEEIEW